MISDSALRNKKIKLNIVTRWYSKESACQETQETWVRSLGLEDPLEEEMATHSCMERGAWWATVHGVSKSQTRLSAHAQVQKKETN